MNESPKTDGVSPFDVAPSEQQFESLGQDNGFRFWYARQLADLLGYKNANTFRKAIERAMTMLTTLGIPIYENIVSVKVTVDGREMEDFKLSRFACYLAAMNGDVKKPEVAKAQLYFITWAEACRLEIEQANSVERVAIRAEIKDHEKALNSAASEAGVTDFALFQNAGYRGMYNMNLGQLRILKGIPSGRSALDFMGKTELAANLFRVTQTEEKIRGEKIQGQRSLEGVAEQVGRKVRKTMIEISGKKPENLPPAEDIKTVHKKLKSSHRKIREIDGPKQ